MQFEAGAKDWEGWRMLHTANKGRKPSTEAGKKCLDANVGWSAGSEQGVSSVLQLRQATAARGSIGGVSDSFCLRCKVCAIN